MTDDNLSTVKCHANWLLEAAIVCFWDNEGKKYHMSELHRHFGEIADALGYDIKLRSAEIININNEIEHEIR